MSVCLSVTSVKVVDPADILRAPRRRPVVLPGVHQHAAQHGPPRGLRAASQRRHHVSDPGDAHDVRDAAVHAAADRLRRRRESRGEGLWQSLEYSPPAQPSNLFYLFNVHKYKTCENKSPRATVCH